MGLVDKIEISVSDVYKVLSSLELWDLMELVHICSSLAQLLFVNISTTHLARVWNINSYPLNGGCIVSHLYIQVW